MDRSVSMRMSGEKFEVFCCYARKDQRWFRKLRTHLASLEREGLITLRDDTDILAGEEWREAIRRHLETAQIILLLVSPNFIASDACYSVEMLQAMERHEQGRARVIPIILHSVPWQDAPFGKLQVLPEGAKPITSSSWRPRGRAFETIVEGIRKVVEVLEMRNLGDEASSSVKHVLCPSDSEEIQPQRHVYYSLHHLQQFAATLAHKNKRGTATSGISRGSSFWRTFVIGVFLLLLCLFRVLVPVRILRFAPQSDTTFISPPTDLLRPGWLTVGSDTTYPPLEFINSVAEPDGFDMDLGRAIAAQMGLKFNPETANFATIIPDLQAKRYDIVISSQMITDEREKQVDFVPYFYSGMSLLVQKGNPLHVQSLTDLCGQAVGVQDVTVEFYMLEATDKTCEDTGKPNIIIKHEDTQTEVIQLLKEHNVIATFQDVPVTDYYSKNEPNLFEAVGSVIDKNVEGISVCKGDTSMFNAVQQALLAVLKKGTYGALLKKWGLSSDLAI